MDLTQVFSRAFLTQMLTPVMASRRRSNPKKADWIATSRSPSNDGSLNASLRGPQARGNPYGLTDGSGVAGRGTASWIAASLRSSQ
jgi:hypothetical protein